MRAKLVSESLDSFKDINESIEQQNESFGVLGVIGIIILSWISFKKLLKFIVNKSLRQVIGGTIKGLEYFKVQASEKFKEEIKVMELNDRYKISIGDGLYLSARGSSKKLTIRYILLFKHSKKIIVNADGFKDLTTNLTDSEYENVIQLIQSEV